MIILKQRTAFARIFYKISLKPAVALILTLSFIAGVLAGCYVQPAIEYTEPEYTTPVCYKDVPGVTDEEIAAIETLKETRQSFAYATTLSSDAFVLPDGTTAGFTPMFCELLSELFGIPFEPQLRYWDSLRNGFETMAIDFIGLVAPTPEQRQEFFLTHSISEHSLRLFTFGDTTITTEGDIAGLRVGAYEGTTIISSIRELYPNLEFEEVIVPSASTLHELFINDRVDVFVDDAMAAIDYISSPYISSREFFPLIYTPVSMATANPELESIISVVDKYLIAGGIDRMYELNKQGQREFARYELFRLFGDEELAYLENTASVPIALEHDNYPVSFYNTREQRFEGIAVDVLAEISVLTGIAFDVVTDKGTAWAEILGMVRSGEAALVSELLHTPDREQYFIWTENPYAASEYAILSRVDYPNLDTYQIIRTSVGLLRGSAQETYFKAWFPDYDNIVYYDTQDEMLDALESGEIDLCMASDFTLLSQINYREKPGFKVNIRFSTPRDTFFGFNKNEEALCSILSKAQRYVNTDKIKRDWTSRVYDYTRIYAVERSIFLMISIVIIAIVLITVLVLLIKNSKLKKHFENQNATLSAIYKSLPDMVFCKDLNFKYTSCNSSFEEFAGVSESEIIGKTDFDLRFSDETATKHTKADNAVLRTQATATLESWGTYQDGTQRLFETVKNPLIKDGKVIGLLGISRDITEHKAAEDEAREASRAKSVFLAHMSHEIRTPMNTIVGMTELIARENISDKAREQVSLIKQASASMMTIINDILDFSKIEAGKLEVSCREYSFASLINDVVSMIRARLIEKPIQFTVNIDSVVPHYLIGDDVKLKQILLNLLNNAVKYTEEGCISFEVTCEIIDDCAILTGVVSDSGIGIKEENLDKLFEVFVRMDVHKNRSIEGTGLGLPITKKLCEAMDGEISVTSERGVGSIFTVTIPQKFARYERLAAVDTPEEKSVLLYEPRIVYAKSVERELSNLGVDCTLVSTRSEFYDAAADNRYPFIFIPSFLFGDEFVKLSKLNVSSKIVSITDFRQSGPGDNALSIALPVHSFPLANVLNGAAGNVSDIENKSDIRFTAPSVKVLFVDDVATNLIVAKELLLPYKMQVDTCESGGKAIELVGQNRYDLIFMDHMMPDMDGIEATAVIRATQDESGYFQRVPIIALTANAILGMREIFLQNGMNDYLDKPIEMQRLVALLKKWIPKDKRKKYIPENQLGAAPDFEIDGIDVRYGVSMSGGSAVAYLKTLEVFYKDNLKKTSQLRDCLGCSDIKLYTILVHGLKSAAMNVGAKGLSEHAKTLEIAVKNQSLDFIMENNEGLLTELDKLLVSINAVLSNNKKEKTVLDQSERELLADRLMKLKYALDNMDAGQINALLKELEACSWDKDTNEAIAKLSQYVLIFEYDEAIELIDSLL